jgi:hypothetical protein
MRSANCWASESVMSVGEKLVGFEEAKACLKTVEGVRWTMAKEGKGSTVVRGKPIVSDPKGLFCYG